MRRAAFIYQEALSQHVLREDHVFRPSRLQYTYELLDCYGAFTLPASRVISPQPIEEAPLLSFHTKEYVEAVKSLSRGERHFDPAVYNFNDYGDNPPYEGMYEASSLAVGASLTAAELMARDEVDVAFNISGGLHHAAPNYASGFCVFNDVVIAINYLLEKGMRVAYVDIDAHHADGVQNAFYSSDKVLTISLHEWGRYLFPGTGEISEIGIGTGKGYSVNLPLSPFTDDEIVPPLVSGFKPDILVTQLGCDTHYLDPLTHLLLTTTGYTEVIRELSKLTSKWLALGGGGYEMGVVARAWTLAYGVMTGQEWADSIPEGYQQRYGLKRLRDEGKPPLDSAAKEQAYRFARQSIEGVKSLVFPLHRL
jgi:acetoin utilization protein AcuC